MLPTSLNCIAFHRVEASCRGDRMRFSAYGIPCSRIYRAQRITKMSRPLAFLWRKRKQQLRLPPQRVARLLSPPLLSGFAVSVVAMFTKSRYDQESTQRVTKGCFRGHSRHHHTSNRAIEGMYSLSRRKIRRTRHTGFDCPMQQSQILISQDQAVPAMQSIVLNRRIMPGIE